MGAIAVSLRNEGGADLGAARRMTAAVPHRGDRNEVVTLGRCALACTYASDLPDAEVGCVDGIAVAFAGTIDNAAELDLTLKREGSPPAGSSTPALLAAAFRRWEEEFPARLRGLFAGAVTDGERVYAFRDHVGYRPLFYRSDSQGFYAATEAKQVIAGAAIPREPDRDVVQRIFYAEVDDDIPCAVRGVLRLPKATRLVATNGSVRLSRFWDPERLLETARLSKFEVQERFDELMDLAVSRALTGRAVISLSGGIDSPALAAFAAPRHVERFGRPLHAQTVVYPRYPAVDERRYVELLASHFKIPLHTYEQTANSLADLDRWVALADSPYRASSMAQYEEDYRRARERGFQILLSGEHAEFVTAMPWSLLDHYLSHRRLRSAWREVSARRAKGSSWFSLLRLVTRSVAPDRVMALRRALTRSHPAAVPDWVDARRATRRPAVPVRDRWRRQQLRGFIGPGISLEAEEVCQAVAGVRSRKPWTDIDLWEFFLSLPAEQKYPHPRPKALVRELLRGRVPDEILDRQDKTVFEEAALGEIDYTILRRYLVQSERYIEGVDYERLRARLESQQLTKMDYIWARNLATAHAFLMQW